MAILDSPFSIFGPEIVPVLPTRATNTNNEICAPRLCDILEQPGIRQNIASPRLITGLKFGYKKIAPSGKLPGNFDWEENKNVS